jgi:hypothetical protein
LPSLIARLMSLVAHVVRRLGVLARLLVLASLVHLIRLFVGADRGVMLLDRFSMSLAWGICHYALPLGVGRTT